jgi:hypothetical protein
VKRPLLAVTAASALLAVSLAERGIARIPKTGTLLGLDIFDYLIVDQDLPAAIVQLLLGVFGALLALRMRDPGRGLRLLSARPRSVALATVVITGSIAVLAFQRYPLAIDEYAPVFQAELFARGNLVAKIRPELIGWLFFPAFVPQFFTASVRTGEVISSYWPGFALALAPFEAAGIGFLLNPVLAGASVLLVRRAALALTAGDTDAAGWAMALLVASPAFLITGASFYSMNAHLFANLAFLVLVLRPTTPRLFAAGLLGGWALSLHQPLPHVAFAVPVFLHLLRGEQARFKRVIALAAGYVPTTLVLVGGWHLLRLRLLTADVPGAAGVQLSGAFSFPTLEMLELRWVGFGKLSVWAPFGLVPLGVLGAIRTRREPTTQLLAGTIVSTLLAYTFVRFSQGHGWGNRYFHSAYGSLVLLAALGLASLVPGRGSERTSSLEPLRGAAAAWTLMALFVLVPQRVYQVRDFVMSQLGQLVETAKLDGTYVSLVRAGPPGYYVQDLIRNDPDLHTRSLMAVSHGRRADEEFVKRVLPGGTVFASLPNELVFRGVGLASVAPEGTR